MKAEYVTVSGGIAVGPFATKAQARTWWAENWADVPTYPTTVLLLSPDELDDHEAALNKLLESKKETAHPVPNVEKVFEKVKVDNDETQG